MSAREEHNSTRGRRTARQADPFRTGLMLFASILPLVARADTVQRFVYRDTTDTATLPKGGQELDYRFWLEDWEMHGWRIEVIRNELTYRFGLTDRTEMGINAMHSTLLYWYEGSWYESECGLNDLQLYGKHQVLREPDWPVTISIGGRAFAPTGSSGGFSAEEWWTGEFIAFSREIGSWRIAGHVGWNDYGNTPWKDNHHWGVGVIQQKGGLALELIGSDDSLKGVIGVSGPVSGPDCTARLGLMIPMDGSDMDWRFLCGLGFFF